MANVLYLTYDGILEPIGQSQVLKYLEGLSAAGHCLRLLSFEKPEDLAKSAALEDAGRRLHRAGIRWTWLRYHRNPSVPATAYDIAAGTAAASSLCLRERPDIVHARSYIPAVTALAVCRVFGGRFIFDMRGFWIDQKVDCGNWRQGGPALRAARWFERRFLTGADAVVTLTEAAVEAIRDYPYMLDRPTRFMVIPTCADLDQFRSGPRQARSGFTLGLLGNVAVSYRFDEMLMAFKLLLERRPDARLLAVNRDDHAHIRARLKELGIPEEKVEIKAVPHAGVPEELRRMDAAVFFLKPFPSLRGVAPTKLAELLACGVPCLSNSGIGDFDRLLTAARAGVIIDRLDRASLGEGVSRLLELTADPAARARCVAAAERHFSLREGISRFDALYRSLAPHGGCP